MLSVISNLTLYIALLHPFYVSVCEIQHNAADKSLEITLKVFADDLELALSQYQSKPVMVKTISNEILEEYLAGRFSLKVDGKNMHLSMIGYETEMDAIWIYMETGLSAPPAKVTIQNTVLMEIFDDQQNLVHFTSNDKTKSLRLTNRGSSGEFNNVASW